MDSDESTRIAALLHEAGETHHIVYRIVDGDDPDWASWYGNWLINLSELPQLLGTAPVRSELIWLLVSLDNEYTTAKPETPWPQWYAERIVKHFRAATDLGGQTTPRPGARPDRELAARCLRRASPGGRRY
jgi:hypothetical protein